MFPFAYRFAILFLSLCAVVFVSCGQQPGQEAQPAAEPQESTELIAKHMGEHYEQVAVAQKALIRGNLDDIREPVNWMASHQTVLGAPEGWGPHIREMQSAATSAAAAQDLETAAFAVASMSLTCGKCHEAVGAEPSVPALGARGLPPPEHIESVPHMLRHHWAVEQMWIGIINPSEDSWNEGVEALEISPLEPQKMTDNAEMTANVGDWAKAVHEIGTKAAQAGDWDSRAELYGELLSTCARCHHELRLEITVN
jgi:cytochrome c553